jgi:hypothetical protein
MYLVEIQFQPSDPRPEKTGERQLGPGRGQLDTSRRVATIAASDLRKLGWEDRVDVAF